MRLGAKSVLIVLLAVVALVGSIHAFASRFILRSFAALEARRAREIGGHAREVLAFEQQQFGESGDDWAKWNDLILYAHEPSAEWEAENLNVLTFKLKSWTDLMIVRDDGVIAWGKALREDDTLGPAHAELEELVKRGKLSFPVAEERPIDGLVRLDGALYLVASRPLSNPGGPTRQHGVLISTQKIDVAWLERFQRVTGLALRLSPSIAVDLGSYAEVALDAPDGIALDESSEDETRIFVRVEDAAGHEPVVAMVQARRPLIGAARGVLATVTLALVVLGTVAAALTLLLLHLGLVRRLRHLAKASDGLTRGDLAALDVGGRDELAEFAREFVAMGRAVLEREGSISAATAKKKLVLDNAGNALVTCDVEGRMVGEVSRAASDWFGAPAPCAAVWDYLAHEDAAAAATLRRDFQTVAVCGSIGPLRRALAGRVLDCRWSLVRAGAAGSIVLLVMNDVTGIVAQRKREEDEREEQRRWSLRSRTAYSERGDRRVSAGEQQALIARLAAEGAPESVLRRVEDWSKAPLRPIMQGLADMAGTVACTLGKDLHVEVRAPDYRVDRERTAGIWASLVHVVRNAVDHGIEPGDEREANGKPRAGSLGITASLEGATLVVAISDDGGGIDWARVAMKAAQRGLRHESQADLTLALFTDGLSTREVATVISGRGVGLAALREAVLRLGGTVTVSSVAGEGTQFRIAVPLGREPLVDVAPTSSTRIEF